MYIYMYIYIYIYTKLTRRPPGTPRGRPAAPAPGSITNVASGQFEQSSGTRKLPRHFLLAVVCKFLKLYKSREAF